MSSVFHWRDTTIIILAVVCNIIAQFSIALNSDIIFLYLAYVLWMLWNSITTLTRSSITKFLDSNEVGRAFSVLGTLQALFPFQSQVNVDQEKKHNKIERSSPNPKGSWQSFQRHFIEEGNEGICY